MDGSTTPIILCVDDDKVTLRAIERSLVNNGYSVLTADSGARALTTLQKTKPNLPFCSMLLCQLWTAMRYAPTSKPIQPSPPFLSFLSLPKKKKRNEQKRSRLELLITL